MKIRTRQFEGRCGRHKRYNPGVEGRAGVARGCPRCSLLCDIWEAAIRLNQAIRKFNPGYDDLSKRAAPKLKTEDPRQLSLIAEGWIGDSEIPPLHQFGGERREERSE